MRGSIASGDVWKLVTLAGVGLGIMWALQALGFGPSWIIGTAGSLGIGAGIVYAAATLRGSVQEVAIASVETVC